MSHEKGESNPEGAGGRRAVQKGCAKWKGERKGGVEPYKKSVPYGKGRKREEVRILKKGCSIWKGKRDERDDSRGKGE